MNSGVDSFNWDFPPEAQDEYLEFLDAGGFLEPQPIGKETKRRSLNRLLRLGEGKIEVPRRKINAVRDVLARLGI